MAASPWPMPGVSTMTRSWPAARIRAITSSRQSGSSCAPRVARLRKSARSPSSEFIRIRSPSSAPPPLRRVGSMAMTAMRSLSCWSVRKRRTSSSVRLDLPEPPVPVRPSTGAGRVAAARRTSSRKASPSRPSSAPVIARARAARSPVSTCSAVTAPASQRSMSQASIIVLTMAARPSRWPSSGEKIVTPPSRSRAISSGTITPPPPPNTLTWPAPASASRSER